MPEFIQWLNSDKIRSLHPLEFGAEAHFRFVSIHPFRDGNGRTGRRLMNLLLVRAGYPIVIISNQMLEVWQQQSQELNEDSPLINIQEPAPFL